MQEVTARVSDATVRRAFRCSSWRGRVHARRTPGRPRAPGRRRRGGGVGDHDGPAQRLGDDGTDPRAARHRGRPSARRAGPARCRPALPHRRQRLRPRVGAEIVRDRQIQIVRFAVEAGDDGTQRLVQTRRRSTSTTSSRTRRRRRSTAQECARDRHRQRYEPVFRYFARDGAEIECVVGRGRRDQGELRRTLRRGEPGRHPHHPYVPGQPPVRAETRVNVRNTRYGG